MTSLRDMVAGSVHLHNGIQFPNHPAQGVFLMSILQRKACMEAASGTMGTAHAMPQHITSVLAQPSQCAAAAV